MPLPTLKNKKIKFNNLDWLLISLAIFLISLLIVGWFNWQYFSYRFYPNTFIGSLNVSSLDRQTVTQLLNQQWHQLTQDGWVFYLSTEQMTLYPTVSSAENSPLLFSLDPEATVSQIWKTRSTNPLKQVWSIIASYFQPNQYLAMIDINEPLIDQELYEYFQDLVQPAQSAQVVVQSNGQYSIIPETIGQKIDYLSGLNQLKIQLTNLQQSPIELKATPDYPVIKQSEIGDLTESITDYFNLAPLTLTHQKQTWSIDQSTLAQWLVLQKNQSKISLEPDLNQLENYLQQTIAPAINQEPQTGQFQREGNRLTLFQPGRSGRQLDTLTSQLAIINNLYNGITTTELIVDSTANPLSENDPASLGIIESIGTGTSNFRGSSANRIYNIQLGSDQISGQLLAPGEEFSLVKSLGKINASTGYKPELVIKGNKTILEYGGGLCQVATTLFRTALAAGLPITQRQNHSYRVSYYEPAGTDATVYDPWPDFRFVNDTAHHILLLGNMTGQELSFTIWGTSDGRTVEQTDPVIYNIIKPAPRKLIETTDLAPGELKCTERAINGADTRFDYSVTYANGEVKSQRFNSHYVPWQEVCLIGQALPTEPETEKQPTDPSQSTDDQTTTNDPADTMEQTN